MKKNDYFQINILIKLKKDKIIYFHNELNWWKIFYIINYITII
jgi:hypothetical protein